MEIRYEKDEREQLLTNCPHGRVQTMVKIYEPNSQTEYGSPIKVASQSCNYCDHFDGYQNSKQIVFCKYGEKE